MEEKKIRVYHTHIEIYPYEQGESEELERLLSIWIDAEYRFEPIGYHILDKTLYVPRGINLMMIEKLFNSTAYMVKTPDKFKRIRNINVKFTPKDRIQSESIDFLSSEGKFEKALKYSQQALEIDTGDGKTYATINAIINLKMRSLIITHQDKIKKQWIKSFLDGTDIDENRIIDISGSSVIDKIMDNEVDGDIFFVNHQTLNSYASKHGWKKIRNFFKKIAVGIKVFDEAHLEFKNILRMDMFSNTYKTFYITANFGRSDVKELLVFNRAFSSVYKFGEETKNYDEKRKHIIYIPCMYRSNPSVTDLQSVNSMYGFSVLRFSDFALHRDEKNTMLKTLYHVLDIAFKVDGKILVTVPKIDDTNFIKEKIKDEYLDLKKSIGTINSKNNKDDNKKNQDCDIIISTIKSCGTGVDIKGLRCVINLEPFSSKITTNQLSGRLREYAKDKDTYFFDLIDMSFPQCERQYKTKLTFLKKKCKAIQIMKL